MLPTDCSPALACPMRGHGDWWGCEAAGSQSQAAGVPPHSPCARSKSPPPPPTFCPPAASSMSTQVLCVSPAGQVGEARAGGGWGWWRAWACGRCGTGALPSIRGRVFASPVTFFVCQSTLLFLWNLEVCVRFFQSCKLEVVLCELHVGNSCRQHGRCLPVWLVQLDERALNGERVT
jgi:hypothetical protein